MPYGVRWLAVSVKTYRAATVPSVVDRPWLYRNVLNLILMAHPNSLQYVPRRILVAKLAVAIGPPAPLWIVVYSCFSPVFDM
jgi:hypothetical protein